MICEVCGKKVDGLLGFAEHTAVTFSTDPETAVTIGRLAGCMNQIVYDPKSPQSGHASLVIAARSMGKSRLFKKQLEL